MLAYQIKPQVYWVGAIDWSLRSFHGYATDRGSTYNAYLIIDEKITLIDNVKSYLADEMFSRIASIIDPSKIDVVISNHGEPDHSGNIKEILKRAPLAQVYSQSPNGVKILKAIYDDFPVIPVKNGEELSIGKRTLKFFHAPMVHWPDNMVTYDEYDKILFSNDIFGQHLASSERFDGGLPLDMILYEAKKYYANIVLPYTSQAAKIVNVIKQLDIEMIATSHGIIWRDYIPEVMKLYEYLTQSQKQNKAVVVYDTMWHSTEKMAITIAETFSELGMSVWLYNINDTDASNIITEIADAKYLAVGSSTINNNMLPTIAGFLCYLKGLAPVGLSGFAFGSYGWGGQSIAQIEEQLDTLGFNRLIPGVRINYVPKTDQLKQIHDSIILAIKNEKTV
ncbi:MAG: FprA family A-type flavoprotein [Bacilli bacterium]